MAEMMSFAGALVINIGTLDSVWTPRMSNQGVRNSFHTVFDECFREMIPMNKGIGDALLLIVLLK